MMAPTLAVCVAGNQLLSSRRNLARMSGLHTRPSAFNGEIDRRRRLQAYEKAGADVLMAPGLPDLASVKAVCAAIAKPFNFMAGIPGKSFTVAGLEAAGVRRISLAGSLYRAAMAGLVVAARELKDKGTFGYVDTAALPSAELAEFMRE